MNSSNPTTPKQSTIPSPIQIDAAKRRLLSLKIGMLGDQQVGKTTLMVKYVKSKFDTTYIETFGVNTMDKVINLHNVDIQLSIWELGGQKEFSSLLPVVCSEAKAIIFIFDLTQKPSLLSIKKWYKDAKKENKHFISFLVGTKYDLFQQRSNSYKIDVSQAARKFAKKMSAPLIYCSSSKSINIRKIFKLIVAKLLSLKPRIKEQIDETKDALIEFSNVDSNGKGNLNGTTCARLKRKTTTMKLVNHHSCQPSFGSVLSGEDTEHEHDDTNDGHYNEDEKEMESSFAQYQQIQNKKMIKKRLKRIKSRLDFLMTDNDEEKLKQIEQILGISR